MALSEPTPTPAYGTRDTSYRAAGGIDGLRRLSASFYRLMDTLPQATAIRAMHRGDLLESQEKLALFLSGWLGGPKLFSQQFGPIHIPRRHAHLEVGTSERDAWLLCMERAIAEQPWAPSFQAYLLKELRRPAERVRQASQARLAAREADKPD